MNTLQSRSFLKNIKNFLCKKLIPYKTYVQEDQLFLALYGSTTIQTLFLKNIENFVWFPKQYLLGFLILEKQLANILDRGFLFLRNTLLLYSLSPHRLTDSQRNPYTRFAWAGGTFFPKTFKTQQTDDCIFFFRQTDDWNFFFLHKNQSPTMPMQ